MAKTYEAMLEPKKFTAKDGTVYHVGHIPCFYAQRMLMESGDALTSFNLSKIPQSVLLDLLANVAIECENGNKIVLADENTIETLLGTKTKTLIEIELKVIEENFGFFLDGSLREVFQPLMDRIAKTLS